MTRDEVRKLADLAGWTPTALAMATEAEWARLEAFAGLIHGYVVHEEREAMLDRIRPMIVQAEERGAKEERESCAKVCDRIASAIKLYCNEAHAVACAEAIRARSAA